MNAINLTGRLTRDPESRATSGGQEVCAMRIAVDGPREADTVFVDVAAFAGLAQTCTQYLDKGRHVAVSGRLAYSEWEGPDGVRRSKHEVVAQTVDFLGGGRQVEDLDRRPDPATEIPPPAP